VLLETQIPTYILIHKDINTYISIHKWRERTQRTHNSLAVMVDSIGVLEVTQVTVGTIVDVLTPRVRAVVQAATTLQPKHMVYYKYDASALPHEWFYVHTRVDVRSCT
jgi:hypothetical protein